MKRFRWMPCAGVLALVGCAENAPPQGASQQAAPQQTLAAVSVSSSAGSASSAAPSAAPKAASADSSQRVIATLDGEPIRQQDLVEPLIKAHGLTMLVNLIQLDLVKHDAAKAGITLTPAEIQTEKDTTIEKMLSSPDDKLQDQLDHAIARKDNAEIAKLRPQVKREHDQLFRQFLEQQHITAYEFDMILEINAYIRKIVEPQIASKITDESLKTAFVQLYGETIRVRHIQLSNPVQVALAQKRLASGEKFEDVAKAMSENKLSGPLGGELPRFSRQTSGYPDIFKNVAFSLKVGQVSDPVESEGAYHLIKLEERFEPKTVTFESQKENVRRELMSRALQVAIKTQRADIAVRALKGLKIEDPVLKKQFDDEVAERDAAKKDREVMRADMERQRKESVTPPGATNGGQTDPGSAPGPASAPTPAPVPATSPGAPLPDAAGSTTPAPATAPGAPAAAPEQLRPPATEPAQGASTRPAAG